MQKIVTRFFTFFLAENFLVAHEHHLDFAKKISNFLKPGLAGKSFNFLKPGF
jgi:hypothetical protein